MSLYRKHRPQKFMDIVGQDHIKKVLTNALTQGKISHAYLFSGPRGTGKTTMARLLAKALNCKQRCNPSTSSGQASDKVEVDNVVDNKPFEKQIINHKSKIINYDYEPCNECTSCVEITGDRSLDVIEIDAASNRGIDEIRELRDKVRFAPTSSVYKVYIIDEVHMLTKEAFNALLKTLEEPPAHAVFIMATTELHKVPDTILSRTQQFDFKRASIKELINNLLNIAKKENFSVEDEALSLIAQASEGSFRDAVSLLDQASSVGNQTIGKDHIKEVLGLVSDEIVEKFISLIESNLVKEAVNLIGEIYDQGYDLGQFNQTIIEYYRKKMVDSADFSLASKIKIFVEAGRDIKTAVLPQIPLELAVIETCSTDHVTSNMETEEQKNIKTEEQNQKPIITSNENLKKDILTANSKQPIANFEIDGLKAADQEMPDISEKLASPNSESAGSASLESAPSALLEKWPEVVRAVAANNHSLGILLKDANALEIKDNQLILGVKFKFYAERIMASDKYAVIVDAVGKVLGDKLGVECVVEEKLKIKNEKLKTADENIISNDLITDALEVFGEE